MERRNARKRLATKVMPSLVVSDLVAIQRAALAVEEAAAEVIAVAEVAAEAIAVAEVAAEAEEVPNRAIAQKLLSEKEGTSKLSNKTRQKPP